MPDGLFEPALLLFGLVVLASYTVQTVSGFGSMLVAVTLGAHLLPIPILLALAVPLSILQTTYILVRHHDGVRWGLLLRRILPLMGAGMVLGYFVFADMAPAFLRRGFGGLILVLSIRELWAKFGSKKPEAVPAKGMHPAASISAMFGAGIVHGVFATG